MFNLNQPHFDCLDGENLRIEFPSSTNLESGDVLVTYTLTLKSLAAKIQFLPMKVGIEVLPSMNSRCPVVT